MNRERFMSAGRSLHAGLTAVTERTSEHTQQRVGWTRYLPGVVLSLCMLCFLAHAKPSLAQSGSARKNVLLVVTADQGYSDIGYQDSTFYTPTLDQLAADGIKLRNMHVSSTSAPTRASILTGRYANKLGMQDGELFPGEARAVSPDVAMLPQLLHANGYANYMVGQWGLGFPSVSQLPLQRGFDKFFGTLENAGGYFNRRIGFRCDSLNPAFNEGLPPAFSANCFFINGVDIMEGNAPSREYNPAVGGSSQYTTDVLAAKAVEFINDPLRDATQPMFMYFAPSAPHSPLDTVTRYLNACPNVGTTPDQVKSDFRKRTCAMMAAVDNAVSQITSALAAKGMLDSTLIIYLSADGGPKIFGSLNGDFAGGKGEVYDGGVRSVAFVAGTPVTAAAAQYGHERTDAVQATDIFATIAEYTGVQVPNGLDSISIWSHLVSGDAFTRTIVNLDFTGPDLAYSGAVKFQQNGVWYKYLNNPSAVAALWGYVSHPATGEFLFNLSTNAGEDPSQNLIPPANPADAAAYSTGKSLMQQIINFGVSPFVLPRDFPFHPSPSGCWIPDDSPYWSGTSAIGAISCGVTWRPVPSDGGPLTGAPSSLTFSTSPLTFTAGDCSPELRVQTDIDVSSPQVLSLSANPSTGVTFYADPGCSTPVTSVTIPKGFPRVSFFMKDTLAGTPLITVSGTGTFTASTTQIETVNPAAAFQLVFTNMPLTLTAGACGTLNVQSQDRFGNPSNAGATETLWPSANPVTGATFYLDGSCGTPLSSNPTIAASTNSATFYVKDTLAGSPTISATGSGAFTATGGQAATQVETVNPAAASKLVWAVQPSSTTFNQIITPSPQILVQDPYSNVLTGESGRSVALTLNRPTGCAGTFTAGSTTAVNDSNGIATFGNLAINTVCSGYAVTASSSGLPDAPSSVFNITPISTTTVLNSVSPAAVQFSDQVTLKATVTPAPPSTSGTITFKLGSVTVASGVSVADAASGKTVAITDPSLTPANYQVTAAFVSTDPNYTSSTSTGMSLTLNSEDTLSIQYTGDIAVSTTTTTAAVNLRATINQSNDGSLASFNVLNSCSGSTCTASRVVVDFLLNGSTNNPACTAAVQDSTTTPGVGVASCAVSLQQGGYAVEAKIRETASYFAAGVDDPTSISVYPPTGLTTNGGGSIADTGSQNGKSNFGFTVKWTKSFSNLQGNSVLVFRSANAVYASTSNPAGMVDIQVKSSNLVGVGLVQSTDPYTVQVTSRANVQIIDAVTGKVVGGFGSSSATNFFMVVTDGTPLGTADKYYLKVLNPDGTLYHVVGALDSKGKPAQAINGGQIIVRTQ